MARRRQPVVTLKFGGSRFEDHALDIDVLPELIAYKAMIVDIAKDLWRRNNPERKQLPAHFDDAFALKFDGVTPGSTCVPIFREVADQGLLFEEPDECGQAVSLVANVIHAAGDDAPLPAAFPADKLRHFEDLGKTLRDDEWFEQIAPRVPSPVRYTKQTRERLLGIAAPSYQDAIDVVGAVTMANVSSSRMIMTLPDGSHTDAVFNAEDEETVTTALKEHSTLRLRVCGRGTYAPDGTLRRITEAKRIELLRDESTPSTVPIWKTFEKILKGVPADQIALLPRDGATQHDHYIYGLSKHE